MKRILMLSFIVVMIVSIPTFADWAFETVDAEGEMGRSSCIQLRSDGNPVISYYKDDTDDLKFAQKSGQSWDIETIEIGGNVGFSSSMALNDQDAAHISYVETNDRILKYTYFNGSNWVINNLIVGSSVGSITKMMLDPLDYPYIGYTEFTSDQRTTTLKCIYKNASGWFTRDITSNIDAYDMIMDASRYLFVSFIDNSNFNVMFAINSTGGSTTLDTIDSTTDSKVGPSIARDPGYGIHVSYGNTEDLTMYYANNDGSGWELEVFDSGVYPSPNTQIILDSRDQPHIIYGDVFEESLKYAWKNASGWNVTTIPVDGEAGVYHSITMDDYDRPHISLYESVNKDLVYVHWVDPTPTPTPPDAPTFTPTPEGGTPTPTGGCTTLGCSINMPSNDFGPNDPCWCTVYICNPNNIAYANTPVFAILDVYGELFFAPDFNDFSYYTEDIAPGITALPVLPEFNWPSGVGSAEGLLWYAAMTNSGMTQLFGVLDTFEFGWHE